MTPGMRRHGRQEQENYEAAEEREWVGRQQVVKVTRRADTFHIFDQTRGECEEKNQDSCEFNLFCVKFEWSVFNVI